MRNEKRNEKQEGLERKKRKVETEFERREEKTRIMMTSWRFFFSQGSLSNTKKKKRQTKKNRKLLENVAGDLEVAGTGDLK